MLLKKTQIKNYTDPEIALCSISREHYIYAANNRQVF